MAGETDPKEAAVLGEIMARFPGCTIRTSYEAVGRVHEFRIEEKSGKRTLRLEISDEWMSDRSPGKIRECFRNEDVVGKLVERGTWRV